jgi:hypothetical protein
MISSLLIGLDEILINAAHVKATIIFIAYLPIQLLSPTKSKSDSGS